MAQKVRLPIAEKLATPSLGFVKTGSAKVPPQKVTRKNTLPPIHYKKDLVALVEKADRGLTTDSADWTPDQHVEHAFALFCEQNKTGDAKS